jgi:hypothetical protein
MDAGQNSFSFAFLAISDQNSNFFFKMAAGAILHVRNSFSIPYLFSKCDNVAENGKSD